MQAIPIAKCYLPYTVLRVEMILESYAKIYSNQFMTGNSPFQLVQCSAVQCPTIKNYKHVNYSSHARQPLSRVNVNGLFRRHQVNIQVFKIIK